MKKNTKYLINFSFIILIILITFSALFSFSTTSHFKEKAKIVEKYCKYKKYDILYLNNIAYACMKPGDSYIKYEQIDRIYYE